MLRRLPPLTSLKAFEAAARHRNFTRAADELHVTQAAISHQVKQLEQWLAVDLFERYGHSLNLTTQGKAYLPEVTRALDILAAATASLTSRSLAGPLRLTVLPSFAAKWLMPRIGRFQDAYPGIDLHIDTSSDLRDFSQGTFDLAIRLGLGRWSGLQADLISHEYLSPLCSPAFLAKAGQGKPLHTPNDLGQHKLLYDQPNGNWRRWLDMAQAREIKLKDGPAYSDSAMVLQAAIDGQGIALGRLFLASDDMAASRLVKPFAQNLINDYSYWLVYPKALCDDVRIDAFRSWLLGEVESMSKPAWP